jgi:nitroreductase
MSWKCRSMAVSTAFVLTRARNNVSKTLEAIRSVCGIFDGRICGMEFFDVINKRGSYRGAFEEIEIPRCDLEAMLEAGIRAPSGYNFQTTSFIVVTRPELKKKLAQLVDTEAMKTASAIIVPLSEHREAANGLSFETEDYAAAVAQLLLAVTALGYAAVWVDGQVKMNHVQERVVELLDVGEHQCVRALIPIGKPVDDVVQREKKPISERVIFME